MDPVSPRRSRVARAALLRLAPILAALLVTAPASAREAWSQEEVTTLAAELVTSMKSLRQTERREVRPDLDPQERARSRYMQTLRSLEQSTKQLDRRLMAGEGYEQTVGVARKIRSLVRDAEEDGKKFMSTSQVEEKVTPVYAVLNRLGRFYFDDVGTSDPMVKRQRQDALERSQSASGE